MGIPADRPLLKVTLNLFEEDVEWMKENWGWGYSTILRDLIHNYINRKIKVTADVEHT